MQLYNVHKTFEFLFNSTYQNTESTVFKWYSGSSLCFKKQLQVGTQLDVGSCIANTEFVAKHLLQTFTNLAVVDFSNNHKNIAYLIFEPKSLANPKLIFILIERRGIIQYLYLEFK